MQRLGKKKKRRDKSKMKEKNDQFCSGPARMKEGRKKKTKVCVCKRQQGSCRCEAEEAKIEKEKAVRFEQWGAPRNLTSSPPFLFPYSSQIPLHTHDACS